MADRRYQPEADRRKAAEGLCVQLHVEPICSEHLHDRRVRIFLFQVTYPPCLIALRQHSYDLNTSTSIVSGFAGIAQAAEDHNRTDWGREAEGPDLPIELRPRSFRLGACYDLAMRNGYRDDHYIVLLQVIRQASELQRVQNRGADGFEVSRIQDHQGAAARNQRTVHTGIADCGQ